MGFFSSHSSSLYLQVPRLKQTFSLNLQSGRNHYSFAARTPLATNRTRLLCEIFRSTNRNFPQFYRSNI
jgi:hypothetical protein